MHRHRGRRTLCTAARRMSHAAEPAGKRGTTKESPGKRPVYIQPALLGQQEPRSGGGDTFGHRMHGRKRRRRQCFRTSLPAISRATWSSVMGQLASMGCFWQSATTTALSWHASHVSSYYQILWQFFLGNSTTGLLLLTLASLGGWCPGMARGGSRGGGLVCSINTNRGSPNADPRNCRSLGQMAERRTKA